MKICIFYGAGMYYYVGYFICPVCGRIEREVKYA